MEKVPRDGRTARRDRNRDAVLDAVLDLFAEDALAPTAAQVADRSGVSLRSVYRYFEDSEELLRAAIERSFARTGPSLVVDGLGEGPLDARITRLVRSRVGLYDRSAPLMRATVLHAGDHPLLSGRLDEVRELLRVQVEEMFAPELAELAAGVRREVAAALDLQLTFESIEQLRRVRGLSSAVTVRVLARSLRAQLGATPPA